MMIKTKCFICEMDDSEPFLLARDTLGITDREFSLFRCRRCDLVFLNPIPDPEEMKLFYPEGFWAKRVSKIEGWYRDVIIYLELQALRRILGKGGRLLDVGSGAGEFLYHAGRLGYDSYGVEISEDMVTYSKQTFGLKNVIHSNLISASFDEAFFDIIILNHVLEHLYNPIETLLEAKRILKKGGMLVIQVPNIDSYQFKVFGKRWLGLSVPQHLYLFTPQTVRLALERAGLNVCYTTHHSIRNHTIIITLSLIHLNPYKLCKKEKEGRPVFFQKLLIVFLNWLFFPIAILEGWLKKGGVITVFARKES